MPYIVLEALAAGKTMIATAVGGIPEIFGAGSPALVQPDAGELAAKMSEALRDPDGFRRPDADAATTSRRASAPTSWPREIEKAYFAALGTAQP